ncbi:MAG: hypothetical protein MUP76_10890 [Acidimicrobiia bacterium]|nr:hypothetical protein [Acidimicrobiia bacterium]
MRLRSMLMIAVLLLAACSGDDATDTTAAETTATTMTIATTATEAPSTTEAPAGPDLTGTWIAELTHVAVEGPCPSTPTQRGPVVLTEDGNQFTLIFPDEDFDCDPIEACAFAGTIDGLVLTGANAGVADDQGGVYHTEFVATWDGADHIDGTGESTYTAEGTVCVWDTALVMDRE